MAANSFSNIKRLWNEKIISLFTYYVNRLLRVKDFGEQEFLCRQALIRKKRSLPVLKKKKKKPLPGLR